jgi:long-chain acyl-CoA synthetase
VHYYGRELSFAQLHARAAAFAHALRAAGIGRGDVVALHLPNCPQYPIAYHGTLMAGATFSPANPLLPPADLAAQLSDSGAVAAVTWGPVAPVLAAALPRTAIRLVLVTDRAQALDPGTGVALDAVPEARDFEAFHADAPQVPPDVAIDVHRDLAHLAYTGGTTGRSKGVPLPHRNVVVNTLQSACWGTGSVPAPDGHGGLVLDQVEPPEERPVRLGAGCAVLVTPWFHAMGTIGGLNAPVLRGDMLVLHDRFDPGAYLADAERFRVTTLGGARLCSGRSCGIPTSPPATCRRCGRSPRGRPRCRWR